MTTRQMFSLLFVTVVMIGVLHVPAPVHALWITFSSDGGVKVEQGEVLGESDIESSSANSTTTTAPSTATANTTTDTRNTAPTEVDTKPTTRIEVKERTETNPLNPAQKEEIRIKTERAKTIQNAQEKETRLKKEREQKEQRERVQKILQNSRPKEIELRKEQNASGTAVTIREFEPQKPGARVPEQAQRPSPLPKTEEGRPTISPTAPPIKAPNPTSTEVRQDDRKLRSTTEERVEDLKIILEEKAEITPTDRGFEIRSNEAKVETTLPVQVVPDKKELSIVTSEGTKTVTTLPDEAVNTIQSSGLVDTIRGEVKLEEKDGDVVYTAQTERKQRFFGFIPVTIARDVEVSAVSGQITNTQQTLGARILDFFSF